jgi:hypothetical protein
VGADLVNVDAPAIHRQTALTHFPEQKILRGMFLPAYRRVPDQLLNEFHLLMQIRTDSITDARFQIRVQFCFYR